MGDPIIETQDLTFRYSGNDSPSLDGVSVRIRRGVRTVILGANGAGKSTLFYHFNGLFRPSFGRILFDGEPVGYRRKGLGELSSRVAVDLQNPDDQIFGQTVGDDVAYGPRNLGLDEREVEMRVERALALVGMSGMRDRNTMKLSYGQRKRLSIAGAIAMGPEVLVMDEPTAGLDPQMSLELMELAEQLHHSGTTVVISTHDVDLAYAWADEIHVLRKGRLIYSGESEGFYSDPVQVYLTGLIQPSMFLINKSLCDMRGVPEAPFPRTETQLVSKMASGPKGRFVILPVRDAMAPSMVDSALPEGIEGIRVLDAFAGSGAMGLEMLSRGAAHATFFEIDRKASALVRSNVESLAGKGGRYKVVTGDVLLSAGRGRVPGGPFDLVVLDPPYAFGEEPVEHLLKNLALHGALVRGALIVFEHDRQTHGITLGSFESVREKHYGKIAVDLVRFNPARTTAQE